MDAIYIEFHAIYARMALDIVSELFADLSSHGLEPLTSILPVCP